MTLKIDFKVTIVGLLKLSNFFLFEDPCAFFKMGHLYKYTYYIDSLLYLLVTSHAYGSNGRTECNAENKLLGKIVINR